MKIMPRVRVADNRTVHSTLACQIPRVIDLVANQDLTNLEQQGILLFPGSLNQAQGLAGEQFVLKSKGKGQYQTGNLMGYVQVEDEQLVIASRFSPLETDYFLHYMLAKVFDIPNLLDLAVDGGDGEKTYDLASFLFPRFLKDSLRKGIYKSYQTVERNDSNMRGGLDLARHIRLNVPFTGQIAYRQREFTFDNPVTQLIRHTIEEIKVRPQLSTVLDAASEEVSRVVEVTPSYSRADRNRVVYHAERFPVRHAYFHEYSLLQRVCLFILRQVKHGLEGSSLKVHGILFDGAWLWEEYLGTLIGDYFIHPQNKTGVGKEHLFSKPNGILLGLIYPDFIGKNLKKSIVADAKYKPQQNINSLDFQQILSYMFRFEASRGYFFYPCTFEDAGDRAQSYRLNGGSATKGTLHQKREIFVDKMGLSIPQRVDSFTKFTERMADQENIFLSNLLGQITDSIGAETV